MVEQLSKDQKDECKEVFDLYDSEKEGLIPEEKLAEALRALGTNPTKSEVEEMIQEIYDNKLHKLAEEKGTSINNVKITRGKIEFNDFIEQYCKLLKDPDTEEDLLASFRLFDKEGLGVISKSELIHIMTTLGEDFSIEQATHMFNAGDLRGDGYFRYEEFVKRIMEK